MMGRPYEVYDGEGHVIESGERPIDPADDRLQEIKGELVDFRRTHQSNPDRIDLARVRKVTDMLAELLGFEDLGQ